MASTGAPDKPARQFVVAGCGYTGERVARLLAAIGPVVGVTRGSHDFKFPSLSWDIDAGAAPKLSLPDGPAPLRVVYLVPPPPLGTCDPRIGRFLGALSLVPERIVYVSTTGVYGDAGGATVTEDTPPAPATGQETEFMLMISPTSVSRPC